MDLSGEDPPRELRSGRTEAQLDVRREDVREERLDMAQHATDETMKEAGREIGADFMLIGTINTIRDDIESKAVMYYQVDLELIDMENNLKVWIGDKKIKKLIKKPKVKW